MGDTLPAVVPSRRPSDLAITAGDNHTCALLDNASVKCWGANSSGQLGLGDVAARGDGAGEMGDSLPAVALGTGRTATAVTAGSSNTCALLDNASVKCWALRTSRPGSMYRARWATPCPQSSRPGALPISPSPPATITPAPCWTTAASSAGALTAAGSWAWGTPLRGAMPRARWATACPRS